MTVRRKSERILLIYVYLRSVRKDFRKLNVMNALILLDMEILLHSRDVGVGQIALVLEVELHGVHNRTGRTNDVSKPPTNGQTAKSLRNVIAKSTLKLTLAES